MLGLCFLKVEFLSCFAINSVFYFCGEEQMLWLCFLKVESLVCVGINLFGFLLFGGKDNRLSLVC